MQYQYRHVIGMQRITLREYVMVCLSGTVEPKCLSLPCQSSPSVTILVSFWFIFISLVLFCLNKLLFSCFLTLKGRFYVAKVAQNTMTD